MGILARGDIVRVRIGSNVEPDVRDMLLEVVRVFTDPANIPRVDLLSLRVDRMQHLGMAQSFVELASEPEVIRRHGADFGRKTKFEFVKKGRKHFGIYHATPVEFDDDRDLVLAAAAVKLEAAILNNAGEVEVATSDLHRS